MPVSASEKVKFINYIFNKEFVRDDLVGSFLSNITEFEDILSKVDFLSCSPVANYDYKLFFNLRAKTFLCQIKGKVYKDRKLLRAILRSIYENEVNVCVMILDNNHQMKLKLKGICTVKNSVNNAIAEATIDNGLKSLNMERLKELIDIALDEKDEEKFILYSNMLNELLK